MFTIKFSVFAILTFAAAAVDYLRDRNIIKLFLIFILAVSLLLFYIAFKLNNIYSFIIMFSIVLFNAADWELIFYGKNEQDVS